MPPGQFDPRHVGSGETIEQRPVPARIDQSAIVMLAVQLNQVRRQFAQQGDAHSLIVDESLAAAIGFQLAAQNQRLARLDLNPGIVQYRSDRLRQIGKFKDRRNAGLVLARPHKPTVGAVPQYEAHDGLARASFTRQHAETAFKGKVERLDQDDIADG